MLTCVLSGTYYKDDGNAVCKARFAQVQLYKQGYSSVCFGVPQLKKSDYGNSSVLKQFSFAASTLITLICALLVSDVKKKEKRCR